MNERLVTVEHALALQKLGIATTVKNGECFIEKDE